MIETHTPGPWKWFDYPDGRKLLCGPDRAVLHCPDAPMTATPADAALIAAAPELLLALKRITENYSPDRDGFMSEEAFVAACEAFDAADAALAKAEGAIG